MAPEGTERAPCGRCWHSANRQVPRQKTTLLRDGFACPIQDTPFGTVNRHGVMEVIAVLTIRMVLYRSSRGILGVQYRPDARCRVMLSFMDHGSIAP